MYNFISWAFFSCSTTRSISLKCKHISTTSLTFFLMKFYLNYLSFTNRSTELLAYYPMKIPTPEAMDSDGMLEVQMETHKLQEN